MGKWACDGKREPPAYLMKNLRVLLVTNCR
jgi:hypothetical protein